MASTESLQSQLLVEPSKGDPSRGTMPNPLHAAQGQSNGGRPAHNASAASIAPTAATSVAESDTNLLGATDLYHWLHFWNMKREGNAEDTLEAFVHSRLRHRQGTPDRGQGRRRALHATLQSSRRHALCVVMHATTRDLLPALWPPWQAITAGNARGRSFPALWRPAGVVPPLFTWQPRLHCCGGASCEEGCEHCL